MPYYAVKSGNIFRCVLADEPVIACVNAVQAHLRDYEANQVGFAPPMIGPAFIVAGCSDPVGKHAVIPWTAVEQAGNFGLEMM